MDAEAQVCRELVSELESLQKKTSLTAEEQARQTAIIDQLNQVMPELNLYIDDQTGKLNMTTEALKKKCGCAAGNDACRSGAGRSCGYCQRTV